jgi:hypothetical protein
MPPSFRASPAENRRDSPAKEADVTERYGDHDIGVVLEKEQCGGCGLKSPVMLAIVASVKRLTCRLVFRIGEKPVLGGRDAFAVAVM